MIFPNRSQRHTSYLIRRLFLWGYSPGYPSGTPMRYPFKFYSNSFCWSPRSALLLRSRQNQGRSSGSSLAWWTTVDAPPRRRPASSLFLHQARCVAQPRALSCHKLHLIIASRETYPTLERDRAVLLPSPPRCEAKTG